MSFPFFELFCAFLSSKFLKSTILNPQFFFVLKFRIYIKNAEFYPEYESIKNVKKFHTKKLWIKTQSSSNLFSNNFVFLHFLKLFQWILDQHEILRFLYLSFFSKKLLFGHISTFCKLFIKTRTKRLWFLYFL